MNTPIHFVVDVWLGTGRQPGDAQYVAHGGDGITRNGRPVPYTARAGLLFRCPGCNAVSSVTFRTPPMGPSAWDWNGNVDLPTLTPSIHHNKSAGGCGWHGLLTGGVFIAC